MLAIPKHWSAMPPVIVGPQVAQSGIANLLQEERFLARRGFFYKSAESPSDISWQR